MNWKRVGLWCLIPLSLASMIVVLWRAWPQPRAAVYRFYREQSREQTLDDLTGYLQKRSPHFDLYYTDSDQAVAGLVLDTAESLFDQVVNTLGYLPGEPVPIILYPDRQELRSAFGWGSGESALGVYWRGTIRLLSPNAWITKKTPENQAKAFRRLNPIAHELTHYVLDLMTDGNYPRWFTEGLAQRVERKATGYLWIEKSSTLKQELYSLADLRDRFDSLSNQPLAYRQSYLLVQYMAESGGEESLSSLIEQLSAGVQFEHAVEAVYGRSPDQLHAEWLTWAEENLDRLEAER